MEIEFKKIDDGDAFKTPSKWVGVIKTGKSIETFDYSQGCGHRIIKKRWMPLSGGVKMPKGWKRGESVPFVYGRMTYDQRYVLTHCTEAKTPDRDDFIHCLVMDASCVRHGQTFEEFALEMGYDEDSRKAERIYNACRESHRKMVRLGLDLEKLGKEYQDY